MFEDIDEIVEYFECILNLVDPWVILSQKNKQQKPTITKKNKKKKHAPKTNHHEKKQASRKKRTVMKKKTKNKQCKNRTVQSIVNFQEMKTKNGPVRLPNLGLTCFMNAALQLFQRPWELLVEELKKSNQLKISQRQILFLVLGKVYEGRFSQKKKVLNIFETTCSTLPVFESMDLKKGLMNDSLRFYLQLVAYFKTVDPENKLMPSLFEVRFGEVREDQLNGCGSVGNKIHRISRKAKSMDYFILTKCGGTEDLLKEAISKRRKCGVCGSCIQRQIQFPKFLCLKPTQKVEIDASIEIGDVRYSLLGAALSTGSHAVALVKRNKQWYMFNDSMVEEVDVPFVSNSKNKRVLQIPNRKFPLGIIYEKR